MRKVTLVGGVATKQPVHHEASHRPSELNYNESIGNALDISTRGGDVITASTVRDVASQIIRPASVSMGVRDIMGGWNGSRIAMYLHFMIETPAVTKHEVITVYSDGFDMSFNGHFPPEMLFRIDRRQVIGNSVATNTMTPNGMAVAKDYMNLAPVNVIADGQVDCKDDLLRPQDALWQMQQFETGPFIDPRTKAHESGTTGAVRDDNSAVRISKMLNGFKQGKKENDIDNHNFGETHIIFDSAANILMSDSSDESGLMALLNRSTQHDENGTFTWKELCSLFGNLDDPNDTRIQLLGTFTGPMENLRNESRDWHGADLSTNLAYAINDKVGKMVATALLMSATFEVGQHPDGRPNVTPTGCYKMFPQMDDAHADSAAWDIANTIEIELLTLLTNRVDTYKMTLELQAFSVNTIKLYLNGALTPDVFTAPAFCTALTSSLIADGEDDVLNHAHTMHGVIDDLIGVSTVRSNANNNLALGPTSAFTTPVENRVGHQPQIVTANGQPMAQQQTAYTPSSQPMINTNQPSGGLTL